MHSNDIALGRNWYTADSARLVTGSDWARWELHWKDGGMVQGVEDTKAEALEALARYGFTPANVPHFEPRPEVLTAPPIKEPMDNIEFNFLPQSAGCVAKLLDEVCKAIPLLPASERAGLINAAKEFERFGVPTAWSPADAQDGEGRLTAMECEQAIGQFIENYNIPQEDWYVIQGHAKDVLNERVPCYLVEYDLRFTGGAAGDYSGTPQKLAIPMSEVDQHLATHGGAAIEAAFEKITGYDPIHLVSIDLQTVHNQFCEPLTQTFEDLREGDDEATPDRDRG